MEFFLLYWNYYPYNVNYLMNIQVSKIQISPEALQQKTRSKITDFVNFIREQGVVGLAIGFILGGAVSKVVSSLVADLINPLIGLLIGGNGSLADKYIMIGTTSFRWGNFIATALDFIIIAAVVYFGFKALRIDRLDKKKETK